MYSVQTRKQSWVALPVNMAGHRIRQPRCVVPLVKRFVSPRGILALIGNVQVLCIQILTHLHMLMEVHIYIPPKLF